MNYNSEQGISLYYSVLIMSVSLAIALGLNAIVIKSFRTTQEVKRSPAALHAADTGIEYALFKIRQNEVGIGDPPVQGTLDNGAEFEAKVLSPTSTPAGYECENDAMYCIYSSGRYQGSKRFIKVTR